MTILITVSFNGSVNERRTLESLESYRVSPRNKPEQIVETQVRSTTPLRTDLFLFALARDTLHKAYDLPAANAGAPSILTAA